MTRLEYIIRHLQALQKYRLQDSLENYTAYDLTAEEIMEAVADANWSYDRAQRPDRDLRLIIRVCRCGHNSNHHGNVVRLGDGACGLCGECTRFVIQEGR